MGDGTASVIASVIAVAMKPGAMALTVMCFGPNSRASTRLRWWMAALLAEYA